jgi:hypothetical protein
LVIEKPLSFLAAMPAETLAFETAKEGLGAFTRAASSFFGSVTKRRVGGLKEGVIGLGGGHHGFRLRAGEEMSIRQTQCVSGRGRLGGSGGAVVGGPGAAGVGGEVAVEEPDGHFEMA